MTNETVIRGELLLDEGDPYSQVKVDKSISKLRAEDCLEVSRNFDGSTPNTKNIKLT